MEVIHKFHLPPGTETWQLDPAGAAKRSSDENSISTKVCPETTCIYGHIWKPGISLALCFIYILFITKKQAENSDERVNPDAHLLHFFENYRSFGSYGHNPPIIPRPEMPICQVSVQIVEQCLRESMALFWTGCACLISIPKRFLGSSTTVSRNRFDGQLKRWDFPNHVSRYVISSYIINLVSIYYHDNILQICHIIICQYVISNMFHLHETQICSASFLAEIPRDPRSKIRRFPPKMPWSSRTATPSISRAW